jgi:DNA-binding MarR family transcriptional regulator
MKKPTQARTPAKARAPRRPATEDIALIAQNLTMFDFPGHLFRVLDMRAVDCYTNLSPRPDVTPRQVAVLLVLFRAGQASQARLSELIRIDRNTLAEMVARLVQRGAIERRPSELDRRAFILELTSQGRDLLFEVLPSMLQAQRELLRPLPAEFHQIFMKCLRLLAEGHDPAPPETEERKDE